MNQLNFGFKIAVVVAKKNEKNIRIEETKNKEKSQ